MKRQIVLFGILALLAACNQQTERKQGFGVHGIDVSRYQKQVDWPQVAAHGIVFAFVKATEGQSMQDSFFCQNWQAMRSAGMLRGAYHFYRPSVPAHLQAWSFLSTVDLQHGDLPPVLDVEVTDGRSSEAVVAGVKAWLSIVEQATKTKPIIYSNQNFFNQHLAAELDGSNPVWIARYSDWWQPSLDSNQHWAFWQYGNRGIVPGISGDVDMNVFRGNIEALLALRLCRPAPLLNRWPALSVPPAPAEEALPVLDAEPTEPVATAAP